MITIETLIKPLPDISVNSFLTAKKAPEISQRDNISPLVLLRNKPELPGFISAWRHKPKRQVVEEFASYCLETQRVSDPYWYFFTPEGEFFSPSANCKVKDAIKTDTHIGRLELEEIEKREQLSVNRDEGVIVWISPADPVFYPDSSKITISEIGETEGIKGLLNRSIVLDIDQTRCLEIAQDLARFSTERPLLSSIDLIRGNPIPLDTKGIHWTYILEELIPDLSLKYIRDNCDLEIKGETRLRVSDLYDQLFTDKEKFNVNAIAMELGRRQMIGRFSTSCPNRMGADKGLFETTFSTEGEYFECPKCQGHIQKGKGITVCPHCGARKEDYGNCG